PKAARRHSGRRTPGARIGPPRSTSESGRLAPTPKRWMASSEPPPGQELQAGRRPGNAGELAGGARIRGLGALYKASIFLVVLHICLISTLVYKTVVFIIETVINIHKHTLSRHHTKAFKLITDPDAFQLLGDETRRRIIYLLRAKEMTVSQIAGELNLTPQAIYHHIRKLMDAGMVEDVHEVNSVLQANSRRPKPPPFSQGNTQKIRSRGAEGLELADFLARDHDALDLRRPFPYLKDLRIPHPLLHRLVLHVARPPEDLDGVRGDFHRDVRREQFRHARLLVHREASVVHRGGAPRQEPGRIHLRLHVREHERDRLLLRD